MDAIRLVDTFLKLIKIDSPSGHEARIISELYDLLSPIKITMKKDAFGNLIVRKKGLGNPLLLSAHVDTVEPGKNIQPVIKNGVITSNGKTILGADNKVAVACIVEMLRILDKDDIQHRPLEVIFTSSEESGNLGAINLDYSKIKSETGYVFDSASPIGTIIIASPFYNRFDIEIIGKAAHASLPHKGINALSIFNKAYSKMKFGKLSDNSIANMGVVSGGSVRNTIPEVISIKGEIRSFKEKELDKFSNFYINEFRETAKLYGGKIKSSVVRENAGYQHLPNNSFVEDTKDVLRQKGMPLSIKKAWGCSDANIFMERKIRVLNLGNGCRNPHTKNESVSIANLNKLTQIMLSLVYEIR